MEKACILHEFMYDRKKSIYSTYNNVGYEKKHVSYMKSCTIDQKACILHEFMYDRK